MITSGLYFCTKNLVVTPGRLRDLNAVEVSSMEKTGQESGIENMSQNANSEEGIVQGNLVINEAKRINPSGGKGKVR